MRTPLPPRFRAGIPVPARGGVRGVRTWMALRKHDAEVRGQGEQGDCGRQAEPPAGVGSGEGVPVDPMKAPPSAVPRRGDGQETTLNPAHCQIMRERRKRPLGRFWYSEAQQSCPSRNASCAFLRSSRPRTSYRHPLIVVMQSTHVRERDYRALLRRLHRTGVRNTERSISGRGVCGGKYGPLGSAARALRAPPSTERGGLGKRYDR